MSDTPLTPLSEEQLSELEKLLVMVTEGPWEFREDPKDNEDCGGVYPVNGDLAVMHFGNSEQYYPTAGSPPSESDLDFILAVRAYTSHLIAEVRLSRASSQAADASYMEGWMAARGQAQAAAQQSQRDCFCSDAPREAPCGACMEAARIEGAISGMRAPKPPPEKPSSQADAVREALDAEWAEAIQKARYQGFGDGSGCIYLYYPGHNCQCDRCKPLRDLLARAALSPSPARDNQLPKGDE